MGDPIYDVFIAMMRYSEIPRDFSSDSLRYSEFGNEQIYRNLRDESPPSDVSSHSGPAFPLISETKSNKESKQQNGHNYVKYTEAKESGGSSNRRRKLSIGATLQNQSNGGYCNYSLGTTPPNKTQSLPPNTSINDLDPVILSALRVPPEELAGQLTLLDFPEFSAIQPDELTSCAWTKKDKHIIAPNIVAFTKRFNHTSFWTVQEILSGTTPKHRAEILSHFIKVSKKLLDLNNLHSLFSIISAMQTASIFRLTKSWSCLSKKDKQTFDRLADIFSDKDNWTNLREYLESLKLPCIPYLGLFLTDLVYIDLAHPHKTGGMESEQRRNKMNNILRVISSYQGSDYTYIVPIIQTQKYLQSIRYIEELQNIFEEDQYKKSLKLEPPSSIPSSSSCSSKESVALNYHIDPSALATLNLSPAKNFNQNSMRLSSSTAMAVTPNSQIPSSLSVVTASATKFIPGHRKCRSLGSKFRSTSLPRNFHQKCHCCAVAVAIAAAAAATATASAKNCIGGNGGGSGSGSFVAVNNPNKINTMKTIASGTLPPTKCKCRIFNKTNPQVAPAQECNEYLLRSRHLLDDSVIEDNKLIASDATSTGSSDGVIGGGGGGGGGGAGGGNIYLDTGDISINGGNSIIGGMHGVLSGGSGGSIISGCSSSGGSDINQEILGFQGCVRRKTLMKDGKKPAVASWQRYWLQIWANSLVYFPPKSFKGTERTDFKREPCKVCSLDGWSAQLMDTNSQQMNTFQLINTSIGTVYKFRTGTPSITGLWLDSIRRAAEQNAEKSLAPVNLMTFE